MKSKKKYECLRNEILDIKAKAGILSDEETAKEKYEYIADALRRKASRRESLTESTFLDNENQTDLLVKMLEDEGVYVVSRETNYTNKPFEVIASVLDDNMKLYRK